MLPLVAMRIAQRQHVKQLNKWILIKVNNLDLLELWNNQSQAKYKKMNRSQWQICLHSDNSLKIQYDFLIHFNNSINSKTTAVLIGCFFIEQSIVWLASRRTRREELRRNNVKPKTCLFTGQVDVQHIYCRSVRSLREHSFFRRGGGGWRNSGEGH